MLFQRWTKWIHSCEYSSNLIPECLSNHHQKLRFNIKRASKISWPIYLQGHRSWSNHMRLHSSAVLKPIQFASYRIHDPGMQSCQVPVIYMYIYILEALRVQNSNFHILKDIFPLGGCDHSSLMQRDSQAGIVEWLDWSHQLLEKNEVVN
jgi:hypothetical protein